MVPAGCYGATLHYLKAVADMGVAAAKADGRAVVARMKAMPTDDDAFGPGRIREDGRKIHPVFLFDMREGAAAAARDKLGSTLQGLVAKGKLAADAAEATLARITPVATLAEAATAALGVEAIVENLDAKRGLFREL